MKRRLVAALLLSTTPISISVSSSSSSSNPNPNPTPPSPRYTPKPNSTPPPVAKCFYKVLKVPRTATPQQIKKAYRRRAVETHPDKNNGSRASFDLVAEAYECVSDPTTRQAYDRAGSVESYKSPPMQAGARNPNSPYSSSMSPENIFNAFFGGGAGSSSHSHSHNPHGVRRKHRDVVFRVSLTLEEMYAGVNSKRILIPKPHVNGSSVRKAVDVRVPIGAKVDGTFVLKGEINHLEDEGVEGGDAVFVFGQVEHERFVRKGDDLAVKVEISLFEALTGFRRTISSLDGREVRFKSDVCSNENKCVSDGDVRVVEGEGMPKGDGSFGNLFVELVVVMPDGGVMARLGEDQNKEKRELLRKILEGEGGDKIGVGGGEEEAEAEVEEEEEEEEKEEEEEEDLFTVLAPATAEFGNVDSDGGDGSGYEDFFFGERRGNGFGGSGAANFASFGGGGGEGFGGFKSQMGGGMGANSGVECNQM